MKAKICKNCHRTYMPERSLQSVCSPKCALDRYRTRKRKKTASLLKESGKENDRLRRQADKEYQLALIRLNPSSIVSGKPTQVIHHWRYKSHSNTTRYYVPNGIPLTVEEHGTIHGPRAEEIKDIITIKKGVDWIKDIDNESKKIVKLTDEYLKEQILCLKKL